MDSENEHFSVEESPNTYNGNRDFTSLKAWKKSRKVKLFFYNDVLPKLPKEEKYQLGSQIRKAAVSPTANIAKGMVGFISKKEFNFIE